MGKFNPFRPTSERINWEELEPAEEAISESLIRGYTLGKLTERIVQGQEAFDEATASEVLQKVSGLRKRSAFRIMIEETVANWRSRGY